ncbi:hypothetical protein CHS0354_006539 [Potamilus streckersoni]|uniref:PPM-type phosphatase domain-containing protein n=1 Tax=Potamilus streckersoni TaxID=2493646 RepID=A0AAE0TCP8_9BIVA|nr:hypothetical protein CHS0354_006539 [Potamilus streckersoni]
MDEKGIQFGTEVFCGKSVEDVPLVELGALSDDIFASYSGPDGGLVFVKDPEYNGNSATVEEIAGCQVWNNKDQKAYGICISLYEQHPVNMKMSGDPIADAFAICCRQNNCIMLIADGVNWGEKSRIAARCALYGSMNYLNQRIFKDGDQPTTTHEVFDLLKESFDEAHKLILKKEGGLTTLCACIVCPVRNSEQFAVCCLNVGDSYGYVFSKNQGIREITLGSHDVSTERDIRDAGGALGPVDGINPELRNMTYGLSFTNPGDIIFLATDGISDNFDPVVTKIAEPKRNDVNFNEAATSEDYYFNHKPEMEPKERHIYALKEMERIVHEFELLTEEQCSAQELCGALVQHVLSLTDTKRKVLENPDLYARRRLSQKEKTKRDSEIVEKMSQAPGKLDHASIVAYEVGIMRPNENEMDNIPLLENISSGSDSLSYQNSEIGATGTSTGPLSSKSKVSRPKKLFAKIRTLGTNSSPTSPMNDHDNSVIVSSRRVSSKRPRSKSEAEHTPSTPSQHGESSKSPVSPTSPMSPISHVFRRGPLMSPVRRELPLPAQHPYRRTISFESSV